MDDDFPFRDTLAEDTYFTPCQLVGSVLYLNKLMPAMSSDVHANSDLKDLTYLQEDYTYLPVWTLGEFTRLRRIRALGDGGPERWGYINDPDETKWEIDELRQGFDYRSTWRSPNVETRRADTQGNPRLPTLQGNNVEAIGRVRVMKGPLILGLHHAVIPMPVDWQPLFGMQKEILRLVPELREAVQRDYQDRKMGDVIRAEIAVAGHSSFIWFLLTKPRDECVGDLAPFVHALSLVSEDLGHMGIQHLVVTRPTNRPYMFQTQEIARFYDEGIRHRALRMVLLTGFEQDEAKQWLPKSRRSFKREKPISLPWFWTTRYITQQYTGRVFEALY